MPAPRSAPAARRHGIQLPGGAQCSVPVHPHPRPYVGLRTVEALQRAGDHLGRAQLAPGHARRQGRQGPHPAVLI
ncbi:hypothetical protein ACFRFU_02955 [Streptomyces sp. NPDC056704]|uniref:hypothetical protein n=1 Tax=Streptomyces TaxID=1883 RepID=UPI00369FABE6